MRVRWQPRRLKRLGGDGHIYSNNIPPELVVNADQISIMLVPVGKRTYARLGAKAIRLLGIDDKSQVCKCFCSF